MKCKQRLASVLGFCKSAVAELYTNIHTYIGKRREGGKAGQRGGSKQREREERREGIKEGRKEGMEGGRKEGKERE